MALTLGKDELLAQISPFYFGVDPRGRVDGVGPALARQLPEMVGRPFDECFEIVRPKVVPGRGLLAVMSGHVVQLRPVERPALGLRGQVVSDGGRRLFVGRPWVTGPDELAAQGLSLADFAPHEAVAETILIVETQRRAVEDARRLEGALREAKERAEGRSLSKSLFVASMSHEIRNPLHVVVGMTDLLAECDMEPEARQYLASLRSNANGLLSLLGDVIDMAQIEQGTVSLEHEPVSLVDLAEEVVDGWFPAASAKGLELFVTAPVTLPPLQTDIARLRQVMSNLIANAIQFTEEGHVNVVVGATERGPTREMFLEVRDTGTGVPVELQDTIFDRFARGQPDMHVYQGAGLGLTITKTLVDALEGRIELQSGKGRGSIFRVAFAQPDPPPTRAVSPLGLRVRVVERSGPVREALVGALRRLGIDRVRVGNGLGPGAADTDVTIVGETTLDGGVARPVIVFGPRTGGPNGAPAVTRLFGALSSTKALRDALHRVAPGAVPAATRLPTVGRGPARRVLVVEDDTDNRHYLRALLERDGHTVWTAEHGAAALALLAEQAAPPDLILSDLHMPVIDGLELGRRLRRNPAAATIPLVAISGHTGTSHRSDAQAVGFDAFLPKPVTAIQLRGALARWCGDGRAALVVGRSTEPRMVLTRHLERVFGRHVVEATSDEEGLHLARRERPREIFVNLDLGADRVWRLLPILREVAAADVDLYVSTAEESGAVERRAAALGCAGLLREPVTRDALAAALGGGGMVPTMDSAGTGSAESLVPLRPDPLLADLVPPYLDRARRELEAARQLVDDGELARVARVAHDLKGTGGAYGLEELSNRARRIENSANAGDAELTAALIERLASYLARIEVVTEG